jgi:hypothetical protein
VGQTGDTFYQRMLLNFSMIRTRKHDNVAEHFYSENHSVNDLMVIGIEIFFGEDTYRKVRVVLDKKKLKTFSPLGLNHQLDVYIFNCVNILASLVNILGGSSCDTVSFFQHPRQ